MSTKLLLALVLMDLAAHQVKAGSLLQADEATIKALAKDGQVDPHKDAITAAKERGAAVVRSAIELAAEKRAEARDALVVAIEQTKALLAKAETDEARAALERQLATQTAELN
jgi:hypothetical protein